MEDEVQLFPPGKNDMRVDYPELSEVEEFALLDSKELRFVWYYSNPTSEYNQGNMNRKEKIVKCVNAAFGNRIEPDVRSEYESGNFPPQVRQAMAVMAEYRPEIRQDGKTVLEQIYGNWKKIVKVEPEDFNKMTMNDKQQYVYTTAKISESIEKIVRQMEEGLGMRQRMRKDEKAGGQNMMDKFHKSREARKK